MTPAAFFLIFFSVLLHAAWHCLSKSRSPAVRFFLAVSFGGFLTTLPFALFSGISLSALPPKVFLFAAFGGFCGMICDAGLSFAYRRADVSLAYPLARALPVIFTLAVTRLASFGAPVGAGGVLGMIAVFSGCLLMPAERFSLHRSRDFYRRTFPWILLAALGTTGYTIFDSFGLNLTLDFAASSASRDVLAACVYSNLREMFLFSFLLAAVLCSRAERASLSWKTLRNPYGLLAGSLAAAAYVLVLLAMAHVSNVSYVQAFRQMSLPAGMVFGAVFLKEKISAPRIAGLLLILAGLISCVLFRAS